MWDLGDSSEDNRNHQTTNGIHILLVEHEPECLLSTAKMLEMCQYRVTLVEFASAAVTMLISEKVKFDAVIANLNSTDLHGFKLLQQAVSMCLLTIVTSNEENPYMAMRALECGAFLYLKKPLTMEILKCIWQHVLRERIRMMRERRDVMHMPSNNNIAIGVDLGDVENPNHKFESMVLMNKNKGKSKKNGDMDQVEEIECNDQTRRATNSNVKRKMCTEWTQELHSKFIDAVEELGEGKCFPKDILERMNVPGLTRMQVASHLQKCRNDNWRSPLERKPSHPMSSDPNGHMPKPRSFGSKPILKPRPGQSYASYGPDRGSETQSENEMPHNGPPPVNNAPYYLHPQLYYGLMGPGPGTAYRHSADEFFSFQEVDSLIHNVSAFPHASGLHHPSPARGAYNFAPTHHDHNLAGPSMQRPSQSQWSSSDTSNFDSDESP